MDFDPLDLPAASRGESSPFGKCDALLERLSIDSETKTRLMEQAASFELPLSEYLRLVLRCRAWGSEHVANRHADAIRAIGGHVGGHLGAKAGAAATY